MCARTFQREKSGSKIITKVELKNQVVFIIETFYYYFFMLFSCLISFCSFLPVLVSSLLSLYTLNSGHLILSQPILCFVSYFNPSTHLPRQPRHWWRIILAIQISSIKIQIISSLSPEIYLSLTYLQSDPASIHSAKLLPLQFCVQRPSQLSGDELQWFPGKVCYFFLWDTLYSMLFPVTLS